MPAGTAPSSPPLSTTSDSTYGSARPPGQLPAAARSHSNRSTGSPAAATAAGWEDLTTPTLPTRDARVFTRRGGSRLDGVELQSCFEVHVIEMSHALQLLIDLDRDAVRATGELRWAPATVVLAFVSAWWIKGPLLVAAAFCADLRNRRPLPLAALAATASFALASGLNAVIKGLVDRSRPPAAMGLGRARRACRARRRSPRAMR